MSFTLRSVTYKSSSEQKHGSYVRILSTGLHEKLYSLAKLKPALLTSSMQQQQHLPSSKHLKMLNMIQTATYGGYHW